MLSNLESADEVMSSQQLKNNGLQGMVICCPVQGKDIKAPEIQVLWRNNEVRFQEGLSNDYRNWEAGQQRGGEVGLFLPKCLSVWER